MRRVDIKIGFLCNNRCKFCVQGEKRKKLADRSLQEIKRNLDAARTETDEVVFTGGEPTLRLHELIDVVGYAKKLKYKVIQIQTNGRLFAYPYFCKDIINAGANEFCLAVHGPNEKVHDFLTSSSGSFEQTVQGIKNLKKLRQYVLTNTVITTCNYKLLPEISQLLISLNVDQLQFAFPHILGTAAENKDWLIPKKSQVIDYVKRGIDIGRKAGKIVTTEALPYCFMQGYDDCVAEKVIPDTKVFDAKFVIDNYTVYRRKHGKIKNHKCKECSYDYVCEGPWREYPKIFGWEEFKPLIQ